METPPRWEPGDSFEGYVIEAVLGEGAMGRVLRARQISLDRLVAIKVLHPHIASKGDVVSRFMREGRAATRIRSRHVVVIHDVRAREGTPYIVMELLLGSPLDAFIERHGAMSVEQSVEVLLALCDAIAAAHRVNIIHRDLKPANILLTQAEDGSLDPKVVDFGISRIEGDQGDGLRTQTHALLGTPAYLAPEQTKGGKFVSPQSDQYALGAILYECVTGRGAFPEGEILPLIMKVGAGEFLPPRAHRPDLPVSLEAVILRAMAHEPSARFESVSAFAAALLPFASPEIRSRWAAVLERDPGSRSSTPSSARAGARGGSPPVPGVEGTEPLSRPPPAPRVSHPSPQRGSMVSGVSLDLPVHSLGPSRRTVAVVGALLVGALLVVGGFSLRGAPAVAPAPVDEFAVSVVTVPPEAALRIDGRPVGTGRFSGRFPRNGAAHVLLATAAGWEPQQVTFVDVSPGSEIRLRRLPSPPPRDVAPSTAPRPTQAALPAAPTPVPTTPPAESSRRTTTRSARHRRADPSMGTPALGPVFVPSAPSIVAGEPSGGSNGASIR